MRCLRAILTCLVFLVAAWQPVYADSSRGNGNDLLEQCEAFEAALSGGEYSGFSAGMCVGYISGARDFLQLPKASIICLPENHSNGQLIKVVIAYIKAHPEKLHEDVALQFVYAMADAFPCK